MGSAILSDDGLYRYRLERAVMPLERPLWAWLMVNPSTADASRDDPTIRKVCGFTERGGGSRVVVGNLYGYRATKPAALVAAADPVGPENDQHVSGIIAAADVVVAAWGPLYKQPVRLRARRWREIAKLAGLHGKELMCFGVAQDGHPRHPLLLPYAAKLQVWEPPS